MIVFVLTKLFAWMYGVEISHNARIALMVISVIESIVVSLFLAVAYFIGNEIDKRERRNVK